MTAVTAAPLQAVRPTLHFTPPQGWMNDPNGLVYFDGEYHLFYQYYPHDRIHGPMHWGHAVSRDLCHWEHLPLALAPDEQGTCFSGSAIVDWHDASDLFDGEPGLLAFYTVHREAADDPEDYIQEQCLAYSRDRGRSWQKYAGNPIIAAPGFKDFRDPKVVWHAPSRRWVMALACGQTIQFHVSENLLDWRLASEFGEGQGAHTDGPWECPDLFELPVAGAEEGKPLTHWVLVVGVGAGEQDNFGSFTQYFVGHFDGERFHNDHPDETALLMDEGRDFYAVQSWSDVPIEDGRRLAIAWLNNWLYAKQTPEAGWRGAMSFPRELALVATSEGLRLRQAFAAELLASSECRSAPVAVVPTELGPGEHRLVEAGSAAAHGGLALELREGSIIELDLQQGRHMSLRLSHDGTRLHLEHRRDGHNGDPGFDRHYPHRLTHDLPTGSAVELEWLIDHGSLELLIDGGRLSLSHLSFANPVQRPVVLHVEAGVCRVMDCHYRRLDV